jgi:ATP-dependent RNA helicase DHX8/PRP22
MEFEQLELLSLVSKITQELSNHVGISDKTLAEFIIDTHKNSKSLEEFKENLNSMDAGFSDSFMENLDRLILRMHPNHPRKNKKIKTEDNEKLSKFSGLALPDQQRDWDEEEKKVTKRKMDVREMDNTLDQLVGLEKTVKSDRKARKRSRSPSPDYRSRKSPEYRERRRSPEYRDRDRDRDRRRPRSRERSPHDDRATDRRRTKHERSKLVKLDDEPIVGKVYDGKVTGIKDFGAFVALEGVRSVEGRRTDGLVHVSALHPGGRVNHPNDIVERGQAVKVKVTAVKDGKISLNMSEVDQKTGKEISKNGHSEQSVVVNGSNGQPMPRKRLTSPERWEIRQLIASGAASAADYPDLDVEYQEHINGEHDTEQDLDLDLDIIEAEPPFLQGQTNKTIQLSPIKVIKAPDGSLNRAAVQGGQLASDRRQLRQQQANAEAEEETSMRDMSAQWNDPMAGPEKVFAQDIRNNVLNRKAGNLPEWKAVIRKDTRFGIHSSLSIQEQRESLPIFKFRNGIVKAVRDNQLLVVVGETGSGKTTQMTQYLAEEGFAARGKIGCTQPRRVAAMSVAKRVAEEVGCPLGKEVGYTIRFEDCTSPETRIKYMTDGMLLRECLLDPDMKQYSVILLDEAHERTVSTDVLFGLLKKAIKRRPDLKIIVTSATLDAAKFSHYFYDCPIFSIPGRTFPVEIMYTKEPESDYLDAALITVMQIHITEPPGDILLFLTGQEEIDTSCEILFERMKALGSTVPELIILPVYATLPSEQQSRIFEPAPEGARKVVIATNIAETSITIDGIYYVIDPGFVKQNCYDPKSGMDQLVIMPISQAQARQRAGRAGRTGPGKCYRMYTEAAYKNEMLPSPVPEIQRNNLAHTILMLKAMGINNLLQFPFMDAPPTQTMMSALEELYALSALDDEGLLTRLGRKMADFPNDPQLSKVLISSVELGCAEEIVTIVAMLTVNAVFYRPKEKQQQADQKKAKFNQPEGDHLTLLTVYNAWKASKFSRPWCYDNFIQVRNMQRAQDVRKQLVDILERHKHPVLSVGRNYNVVRRAMCAGFFRNVARKDPQEGYKTVVEGTPCYIHPSSALFGKSAEWVIYHELVLTGREYMREATVVEPKWLVEAAPTFFKVADTTQLSKRQKTERIEPLFNRFAEKDDWRISKQKAIKRQVNSTFQ